MTPVELLLSKLKGTKNTTSGWSALCPAHEDRKPSLSVSEGDDGRALVKCHAGCTTEAVCAAVGLTLRDLMPERNEPTVTFGAHRNGKTNGKVFATANAAVEELETQRGRRAGLWTYLNTAGEPVGVVIRWDLDDGKKDIRPVSRHPDGWRIEAMPDPRPLYGLPELPKADRVLVVEGEKCVDAARALGFTATTSAGGSQAAGKSDWSSLVGKEVWLLPDNDAAGGKYADIVTKKLASLRPPTAAKLLDPHAAYGREDLPAGYDIADAVAECVTDEDRVALRERIERSAASGTNVYTAAEPSTPPAPDWPAPLAVEAYHGLAGRFVRAIEPHTEADAAALLVQFLLGIGNAIGRTVYALADGSRHHANEYAVLVGQSAKARKGTSWSRVRDVLTQAAQQWAENRVLGGLSSGEGLIWAVRDPVEGRERIKERGQPVRYETVVVDEGEPDKRVLIQEPEFANVLKQTERTGNTLSAVIRQAWDGGNLRTLTKNSPAKATGAHVSMIGHITREELQRYLTATESANGFGNRYMWFLVKRSKFLPFSGTPDPVQMNAITGELATVLEFVRGAGEMPIDPLARALWCEVYPVLSRDRYGLAGALTGRAEAHVLRLALIYAVLDRSPAIQVVHLTAALAVWEYSEQSVTHIFGDATGNPLADELLRLLRAGGSNGLTRNELHDMAGKHHPAARFGSALGLLLTAGLAHSAQRTTTGRPAEVWFAGPARAHHAA
ncbi:hypothetical protein [Frigoriglobus tundricola]|uniref:Toprim domain-containing protein n=1 Tax=Frigoriglobus tundricola TaxID=2774151 RepID=A0A6M5YT52_9BACT|nr:hypothetical protein [Frigoriglobus tundricola]QJW97257.1 hypothetical protein FTUN_4827 [Frigoriglobus tundricola]